MKMAHQKVALSMLRSLQPSPGQLWLGKISSFSVFTQQLPVRCRWPPPDLEAGVAIGPLHLYQGAQGASSKHMGVIHREKMVHGRQGDSRSRAIRCREAVLDGEQMGRAAFKSKQSVKGVKALRLGWGVQQQRGITVEKRKPFMVYLPCARWENGEDEKE